MTEPSESIFCTRLPHQPRIWDPSMLRIAMQCSRKHWLMTIRGLRRNGGGSVHQEWGSVYHECVEWFDRLILKRRGREFCGELALSLAFSRSWDFEAGQPKWGEWVTVLRCTSPELRFHKKQPEKLVKNTERCIHAKQPRLVMEGMSLQCECGLPMEYARHWLPYHRKKTRLTLLRAVALYCDTADGVQPHLFGEGVPAVEVQERIPLPLQSPDHSPYELVVNIDSIVEVKGRQRLSIRERKTTGQKLDAKYWRQFDLDPQIDSYDLVGAEVYSSDGIMVEATRVGEKDAEIQRQQIYIPEERREEWLEELQGVIAEAETGAWMFRHNMSLAKAFPRRSTSCHGAYGTCPMFAICSAPKSEREAIIEADYHVERWNPLTASRETDDEAGSD